MKYNIAHILPWAGIGGVEQATLRLAQALRGYEFNNIIFCTREAAAVESAFSGEGFETAEYAAVQPSYRRPKAFLQNSFRLVREFERRNIDMVHCSDLLAAHYTGVAAKLARLPVLCHIRCCFEKISRRDQSFLRPINKFVFVAHSTKEQFGYKIAKHRGVVIYDGIDEADHPVDGGVAESVRREFGIPEEAKIIGMIARIAPAKDYETLARAAAKVVAIYPNVRFLIVGSYTDGPANREHYQKVKRMLAENGVAQYFIFTGFRPDVSRLIEAMDMVVLSTHSEGFPLVILEAMAHAKPVIATSVGGVPELIADGETGLLHRHKDHAELAAKILSLLNDETCALRLGIAGLHLVKMRFTKEQFAANVANLYRHMLRIRQDAGQACVTVDSVSAV